MKVIRIATWTMVLFTLAIMMQGIYLIRVDNLLDLPWIGDAILFFFVLPMIAVAGYSLMKSSWHRWMRRKLRGRPKPIPISYGRKKMERERRRKSG